ncbi:MAG: GNAT family N-acetyltransferase [Robiginitomaculum sp.]|nr:MAG: GNAT family N-acetyltransferase [Robiginitomaculum sp.]
MHIRPFSPEDITTLLVIYNDVIATSTAIYLDEPISQIELQDWVDTRLSKNYPVLVAILNNTVVGFSSFGDWRAKPGYRFTVEHTVHIAREKRGHGIGGALLEALFPFARTLNKHVMLGVVDADNIGSLRFHERYGFTEVARFPQVGFKFNRWLDAVFMQKFLNGAPE